MSEPVIISVGGGKGGVRVKVMEGTRQIVINMEGTPPLRGEPYPTL
jgi:hypothetical protein